MKLRDAGSNDAPNAKFLPGLDAYFRERLVFRQEPNPFSRAAKSLHRKGTVETGDHHITRFGRSRLVDDQQVAVLNGGPLSVHAVASCPHEEGRGGVLNEQVV